MWLMVEMSQHVFKQILSDNVYRSEVVNDSSKIKMGSLPLDRDLQMLEDKSYTCETIKKIGHSE